MRFPFRRRRLAPIALGAALAAMLVSGSSERLAAPAALTPSSAGALALVSSASLPRGARDVVTLAPAQSVSGAVVLEPRNDRALVRFIASVSNPDSPGYRDYLAPGAFARRFGPSAAALHAVERQLRTDGLHLGTVSRSRLLVPFTGSSAEVQAAFHTALVHYRLGDGASARGTLSAVRVPESLSASVAAVVGLSSSGPPAPAEPRRPTPAGVGAHRRARTGSFYHPAGSPRPCSAATAVARANNGLSDDQIANAYGAFGLYADGDRGNGQRIALYENEPFLKSDIAIFDTCYFGAARAAQMLRRLHTIPVAGGQPTGPGSGEASLDVENVSALAPGAQIDVYVGPYTGTNPTDYDSLDEYAAIVDADRDPIVSTSWGLCEQAVQNGQQGLQQAENLLFQQAAAQGQTIFAAAGDNGSDDCNVNELPTPPKDQDAVSVDDPASQPYAVAVGGTSIADASRPQSLEQVWNGGPGGGAGGGGISQSWEMPSWQRHATVPGIALPGGPDWKAAQAVERTRRYSTGFCHDTSAAASSSASTACRLVPDVSSEGDSFTGAVTVYSQAYAGTAAKGGWTTIGGTSSATPIWAAMLALIDASPACTTSSSAAEANGLGFLSPQLYALASDSARYRASFHDIVTGNNDLDGLGGGRVFAARPGYDLASGLGSPQLTGAHGTAGLAYYLCTAAGQLRRPVVSGLSPQRGSVSGGETVTVTGSGFGSAADPAVSAVQVGIRTLAPGSFRVLSPTSLSLTLPAAGLAPHAPAPQDGAGPAEVIVTLRGGLSSMPGPQATFDYLDQAPAGGVPSIEAISPSGGLESSPHPVTILGAGFTGSTAVSFGGVPAVSFTVQSPYRILATPPAITAATGCVALPSSPDYAGEDAANDVCQVAVRVVSAAGASASAQILPPLEGAIATNSLGVVKAPPGCGCEGVPAPNEYDYVPRPSITAVSTSDGPAHLASERGGTVITIRGQGLNPLTLDWADFGNPSRAASQDVDYVFLSGTEMQISAPGRRLSVDPASVRVSVHSLGGQSPHAVARYAGVPRVSEVVNVRSRRRLRGAAGAQDAGGAPIRLLGRGLAGQLTGPLRFQGAGSDSGATQYVYRAVSDKQLDTRTVGELPGLVMVRACTVTGCSPPARRARLLLYPPGSPLVNSVTPGSGSAAGGTKTVIGGENLSCPLRVYFGARPAYSLEPVLVETGCGVATQLRATSPAGSPGTDVPVAVETAESYFTGTGRGSSRARFRYTH